MIKKYLFSTCAAVSLLLSSCGDSAGSLTEDLFEIQKEAAEAMKEFQKGDCSESSAASRITDAADDRSKVFVKMKELQDKYKAMNDEDKKKFDAELKEMRYSQKGRKMEYEIAELKPYSLKISSIAEDKDTPYTELREACKKFEAAGK